MSFAGWSDKFQALLCSSNPVAGPHFNFSVPESMGVVAVVAPRRPSLLGLLTAVLPILVTGNTCVVLASEEVAAEGSHVSPYVFGGFAFVALVALLVVTMMIKVGETSIYVIVVNSTLVFLFLSFTIPLVAAMLAYGGPKWPKAGPWNIGDGLYRLVTILAVVGMGVILFIAVAPPNERVLYVVLSFIVLALVVWVLFESRRFEGPPTGERIAARKAAIAAAEAAVGER